jgi:FMN-binding domain
MKRAPLLVLAGTVAGFVGVLSFHTRQLPPTALSGVQAANGPSGGAPSSGAPSGGAASATPGPTAGHATVRTAVGPSAQFGYGLLEVKVTVRGTRITNVSVSVLETAEPTSQQISEQVIPMLTAEALSAQSAGINAISGATYTSEGYAQSLQAALDKLHIK